MKKNHDEKVALHKKIIEHEQAGKREVAEQRGMVVVKANSLIQKSRYELSLQEQRIILYLISKIKPDDTELKEMELSIQDFSEICGLDYTSGSNAYVYIKKTIKSLADKSEWISFDNNSETLVRWIDTAKIEKGKGIVKVGLSKTLMPYLLELKKQYTSYQLLNILPMTSKYSIRLYELLKSYSNLGHKRFNTDELKIRLGAETYKDITNFKNRVLFPALKDIEQYGDIKVSLIVIKEKNKIVGFEFIISPLEDIDERMEKWENISEQIGG